MLSFLDHGRSEAAELLAVPHVPLGLQSAKRRIWECFSLEALVTNSIMRARRTTAAAVAALSLKLVLQASSGQQPSAPQLEAPQSPAHFGSWGVDLTGMDKSVKPGDDFDRYVNGAWNARTEIPPDQPMAGVGFDVFNRTQAQVRSLIEQAPPTSQFGAMYRSFMDEATVDALDDKPLRRDLERVAAIATKDEFTTFMGETNGTFGSTLFEPGVAPDPAHPELNTLFLGQAGLGLPDRDYYLKDTFKPQRNAYRAYIERTFTMTGYPEPAKTADAVMAFETEIAKVSWAAADRRDIDKVNNPMTIAELRSYAPGVNWDAYLAASGIAKHDRTIVLENSAVKDISALYAQTPLDALKAWQSFHIADQASPYLSKRFVDSRFTFTKTLSGVSTLRERWRRGVQLVDGTLGELLGHAYVDTYFPPASKAAMNDLVANLKSAMAGRIQENTWMSADTKKAALEKLAKMDVMVGYPDKWRDYSGLKVDVSDLYGNVQRSGRFEWEYQLSDLGKPVDRKKWAMTPQTVDAYNGGLENKIVFPAGILQPPVFDPTADSAVNYGAIGAVIGHEITHGFDDQGRKIDATGAVRDWWTKTDAERFNAHAKGFGAQYDAYEPVPGMHINGQLTMGENIADMAGVLVAYDAYRTSLKGQEPKVLDGFTGVQRFFLAYAQSWRGKQREDAVRSRLASDPHSPPRFRIIGPLRNVDAWYDAFRITDGTFFLKPEERTRIW
jgi:putative endopeptidase